MAYFIFITTARFELLVTDSGVSIADLTLTPLAWGVTLAVALLVSIVLHEFGHALVAKAQGIRVRSITLMMLGGMTRMENLPGPGRYSEFKLSIVGPLVSLALAAVFALVYRNSASPDLVFFAQWMSSLNLVLAIFNLLPAFPLDGGRALRSVLAEKRGLVRATQISVRVSKVLAYAFGILAIMSLNILLLAIAFFVYIAAQSELFFVVTQSLLRGLKAGEVATPAPSVPERSSLRQAAGLMLDSRCPILPVSSESGPVFLVTLEQIRRVPRNYWDGTLVKDVMLRAPKVVRAEDPIEDTLRELAQAPMSTLPVSQDSKVIGVIRYSDLTEILQLRSLQDEAGLDKDSRHEPPSRAA